MNPLADSATGPLTSWQNYEAILPLSACALLAAAGLLVRRHLPGSLFVIAAATRVLSLLGIRNEWDTATHIIVTDRDIEVAMD